MASSRIEQHFFDSTRGRIAALLRRHPMTVDELAAAMDLTDNAVRAHLATLERDGLVRQQRVTPPKAAATAAPPPPRRVGKPAHVYEIAPDAEPGFSRAYAPVLTELLQVLAERLEGRELEGALREVGRRLGAPGTPPGTSLAARVEHAANTLNGLGGIIDVERRGYRYVLRGYSCPLGDASRRHPEVCRAVETLVATLVAGDVREQCVRGERPRCCFEIRSAK
jgi:predicted ArsR family transcriptional regulator